MSIKSLEQFEQETEAKRQRLLKDIELVAKLPTTGKVVNWTGEGGFEQDGNTRKPDVEKSLELLPSLVHSPFRGHEHVAFSFPDGYQEPGEYQYSKHRKEFVRGYLLAILDACEPYMVETVAVRGTYASLMPADFDYKSHRDYKDATEVSRGLFELESSQGEGYTSLKLSFYFHTEEAGTVEVSINLDKEAHSYKLVARGHRAGYGDNRNAQIESWSFPSLADTGAVNLFKRANATRTCHGVPTGYTLEWLFDSREKMLAILGL